MAASFPNLIATEWDIHDESDGNKRNQEHCGSTAPTPEPLAAEMSCDVAIVGYGPVGMIIGVLLAQRGYSVIAIERWPTRYDLPRAGHFDSETMRTFQNLGFAESIELIARPCCSGILSPLNVRC